MTVPITTRIFSKSPCGAVLLEAMLTVILLSVGLTVMIQAMASSGRAIFYSSGYSTAVLLLENKMFELMEKGFLKAPLQEEKKFPEPYSRYRYQLRTQNIPDENGRGKMNLVNLKVSWGTGPKERNVSIVTYFFDVPAQP